MELQQKPGYVFAGWYVDPQLTRRVNPAARLPEHIQLYEKWTLIDYPVIYELEEGMNSPYNPRSVNVESGIVKLYPAVCKGKQFAGWMKDGKRVSYLDVSQPGPIRLIGRFQQPATISFDSRQGSRLADVRVPANGERPVLPQPIRVGYDFAGWYLDPDLLHPLHDDHEYLEDTRLYADWALREYEVRYDLQDGHFCEPPVFNYTCLTPTFVLPCARRENAVFKGWFDERGNLVTMIRKGTIGDQKLSAAWEFEPWLRVRVGE